MNLLLSHPRHVNRNLLAAQNDHVNRFEIAAGAHRSGLKNVHLLQFKIEVRALSSLPPLFIQPCLSIASTLRLLPSLGKNPDNSEHARRRLLEWDAFLRKTTPVLLRRNKAGIFAEDGDTKGSGHGSPTHDGVDGLHFDLHRQADGSYSILLFDLCRHIQQWSQAQSVATLHNKLFTLGRVAVFVVALIPFFDLINQSYTVSSTAARTIVFLAFTTFDAVFFLSTVLVGFLVRLWPAWKHPPPLTSRHPNLPRRVQVRLWPAWKYPRRPHPGTPIPPLPLHLSSAPERRHH